MTAVVGSSPTGASIPLHVFPSLSSTSDWAREALQKQGLKAPFAVYALTQTQGRGRQGRVWESLAGNLFYSIVLPVPRALLPRQLGLLSLAAGAVVAQWLSKDLGLHVTLKWPNDVLFAGRKLAGILCECLDGETRHVIIGIGLNVATTPSLAKAEYAAIALHELLPDVPSLDVLAAGLTASFQALWHNFDEVRIRHAYERQMIPAGHALWRDGQVGREKAWLRGVSEEGALLVQTLGDQAVVKEVSAEASWRWVYQDRASALPPLVVLDVGNTRLKVAYYGDARRDAEPECLALPYDATLASRLQSFLASRLAGVLKEYGRWPLYMASVNSQHTTQVTQALHGSAYDLIAVPRRLTQLRTSHYDVTQIGMDRLAMLEAAASYRWENGETARLLVSAGTAVTVDLLDHDAGHVGGFIVAGLSTKLAALHHGTGALPLVLPELTETATPAAGAVSWPRTTVTAMLDGACRETAAFIWSLVAAREKETGVAPSLWLSGGDALILQPYLPTTSKVLPNLVLEGLRTMILGGLLPRPLRL